MFILQRSAAARGAFHGDTTGLLCPGNQREEIPELSPRNNDNKKERRSLAHTHHDATAIKNYLEVTTSEPLGFLATLPSQPLTPVSLTAGADRYTLRHCGEWRWTDSREGCALRMRGEEVGECEAREEVGSTRRLKPERKT
ncbi:hypothetical protein EYF80_027398 [Liparis tanakae]|uniref:Uncharacterized protein n=1 Tax=Liparis tanakae TaxID=230148 RepID=A0A4Z2H922_9TELE|nr:hypothetical protein EYF80_027398 [Liparis tanakae]